MWPYCGHLVDLPDVNESGEKFVILGDRIKAPLSLLHGIGPEAHLQLCSGRPYGCLQDLLNHMKKTKEEKGRCALHIGVISKLIAVGSMDSLFPKGMSTIDKFETYRVAYKATFGDTPEVKDRYKFSGVYEKYQIAKSILPEYSMSLIKTMVNRGEPGVIVEGDSIKYQNEIDGQFRKYHVAPITEVEAALEDSVWGGQTIEVACPAYVLGDRRFTYQGDKHAASLTLDIEGVTREFVKWPPRGGKTLPEEWQRQKDFTGCIVMAILQKYKEDRPFAIVDVVLVQPAIEDIEKEPNHDK